MPGDSSKIAGTAPARPANVQLGADEREFLRCARSGRLLVSAFMDPPDALHSLVARGWLRPVRRHHLGPHVLMFRLTDKARTHLRGAADD